ncbi:unnamed protein product [Moneuplotes crassus]|uniref:Uncharacterized protein n=1 Tax=Euplotes crassus TaxID=5936 RepID=A0AAD1UKE9_EUPCR|nr:unnamed protein product [Moneuplotes crassus]
MRKHIEIDDSESIFERDPAQSQTMNGFMRKKTHRRHESMVDRFPELTNLQTNNMNQNHERMSSINFRNIKGQASPRIQPTFCKTKKLETLRLHANRSVKEPLNKEYGTPLNKQRFTTRWAQDPKYIGILQNLKFKRSAKKINFLKKKRNKNTVVNPLLQAQEDYLKEASQRGETMRNIPSALVDTEKGIIPNMTQREISHPCQAPRKHHIMGIKSKNAKLDCMKISPTSSLQTRYQLAFKHEPIKDEVENDRTYYRRRDEMAEFNESYVKVKGMTRLIVKPSLLK